MTKYLSLFLLSLVLNSVRAQKNCYLVNSSDTARYLLIEKGRRLTINLKKPKDAEITYYAHKLKGKFVDMNDSCLVLKLLAEDLSEVLSNGRTLDRQNTFYSKRSPDTIIRISLSGISSVEYSGKRRLLLRKAEVGLFGIFFASLFTAAAFNDSKPTDTAATISVISLIIALPMNFVINDRIFVLVKADEKKKKRWYLEGR
jgi:hypothetical protein